MESLVKEWTGHARAALLTTRRIMRLEGDSFYLVGFPRSGNHYVSVCLEKYTDNQSPISNYRGLAGRSMMVYRIHAGEFRSIHDLSMNARFRKVVFLYRNPVDTLYSYCRYMNILPDEGRIRQSTTKEEIKALVDRKDDRVINITKEYRVEKEEFVRTFGHIIMERIPSQISEVLSRDALETKE